MALTSQQLSTINDEAELGAIQSQRGAQFKATPYSAALQELEIKAAQEVNRRQFMKAAEDCNTELNEQMMVEENTRLRKQIERTHDLALARHMEANPDDYSDGERTAILDKITYGLYGTHKAAAFLSGQESTPQDNLKLWLGLLDEQLTTAKTEGAGEAVTQMARAFASSDVEEWKRLSETEGLETLYQHVTHKTTPDSVWNTETLKEMVGAKGVSSEERNRWLNYLRTNGQGEMAERYANELKARGMTAKEARAKFDHTNYEYIGKNPKTGKYEKMRLSDKKDDTLEQFEADEAQLEDWVVKTRAVDAYDMKIHRQDAEAMAKAAIPFLNERDAAIIAAAIDGEDLSPYEDVLKRSDFLMDLCEAVRPRGEHGAWADFFGRMGNGFKGGWEESSAWARTIADKNFGGMNSAYWRDVIGNTLLGRDDEAEAAFAKFQKERKAAHAELVNDVKKDLEYYGKIEEWIPNEDRYIWEQAIKGYADSFFLNGLALAAGGAGMLGRRMSLAPSPWTKAGGVALQASSLALEAFGAASMIGSQYKNMLMQGVDADNAAQLAFYGGVIDWLVEKQDVNAFLGISLSPSELRKVGIRAAVRSWAVRRKAPEAFKQAMAANAAQLVDVGITEAMEEYVQALNEGGFLKLAQNPDKLKLKADGTYDYRAIAEAFLNDDNMLEAKGQFIDAVPTCFVFGATGSFLSLRNSRRASAASFAELTSKISDEYALRNQVDTANQENAQNAYMFIKDRAARYARMTPEARQEFLKAENCSPSEAAYYEEAAAYYQTELEMDGQQAADNALAGSINLAELDRAGIALKTGDNGDITGINVGGVEYTVVEDKGVKEATDTHTGETGKSRGEYSGSTVALKNKETGETISLGGTIHLSQAQKIDEADAAAYTATIPHELTHAFLSEVLKSNLIGDEAKAILSPLLKGKYNEVLAQTVEHIFKIAGQNFTPDEDQIKFGNMFKNMVGAVIKAATLGKYGRTDREMIETKKGEGGISINDLRDPKKLAELVKDFAKNALAKDANWDISSEKNKKGLEKFRANVERMIPFLEGLADSSKLEGAKAQTKIDLTKLEEAKIKAKESAEKVNTSLAQNDFVAKAKDDPKFAEAFVADLKTAVDTFSEVIPDLDPAELGGLEIKTESGTVKLAKPADLKTYVSGLIMAYESGDAEVKAKVLEQLPQVLPDVIETANKYLEAATLEPEEMKTPDNLDEGEKTTQLSPAESLKDHAQKLIDAMTTPDDAKTPEVEEVVKAEAAEIAALLPEVAEPLAAAVMKTPEIDTKGEFALLADPLTLAEEAARIASQAENEFVPTADDLEAFANQIDAILPYLDAMAKPDEVMETIAKDAEAMGVEPVAMPEESDEPARHSLVTPEQAKVWMPNTYVVDENGNPALVYHGTRAKFNVFRNGYINFTNDEATAKEYANGKKEGNPRVIAAYVNLEDPLEFDNHGREWGDCVIPEEVSAYVEEFMQENGDDTATLDLIADAADDAGYDGLIVTNIRDNPSGYGKPMTEVIAFRSSQVKAADGTTFADDGNPIPMNKRGDLSNPDTRYSFAIGEFGAHHLKDNLFTVNNLGVARKMLAGRNWAELSREEKLNIKLATGWEMGADGKWRHEILDLNNLFAGREEAVKKARDEFFRIEADYHKQDRNILDEMNRIFRMGNEEAVSRGEHGIFDWRKYADAEKYDELRKARDTIRRPYLKAANAVRKAKLPEGKLTVGDFAKGMPVAEAYPEIMKYPVKFRNLRGDLIGEFDPTTKTITLDPRIEDTNQFYKTIIHEVQHAIQSIEGFAVGGNDKVIGFGNYQRLGGEVESRNAEYRTGDNMDFETLLEDTESIAREDQHIFFSAREYLDAFRAGLMAPRGFQKQAATAYPDASAEIRAMDSGARYSLITPEQAKEWMPNTKVVDADGNPMMMFHGTVRQFNVFEKTFSTAEGDMGKGFYFTSSESDVERNYANVNGPDLEGRIERLADNIESRDDISHEEALEQAKRELEIGDARKLSVYLNVEKPFVIGGEDETFLDVEDPYNEETEEYGEPTGPLVEAIDAIKAELGKRGYNTEGGEDDALSSVLWSGIENGGLSAEAFVKAVKDAVQYVYNDEGDIAGNEVLRAGLEGAGYDGIIDHTVSTKFKNMGIPTGTQHVIVFKPTQIKLADGTTYDDAGNPIPMEERGDLSNPDIRYSLVTDEAAIKRRTPNGFNFKLGASVEEAKADVERVKNFIKDRTPVATQASRVFQKDGTPLTTKVFDFYESNYANAITHSELGKIALSHNGIKADMAHGLGAVKCSSFALVPEALKSGVVYNRSDDWKGRGWKTAVVADVVSFEGENYLLEVVVIDEKGTGNYELYDHEMTKINEIEEAFKTPQGRTSPITRSIIAHVWAESQAPAESPDIRYSFAEEERTTRLAPNGQRSNLTDRQYDLVRIPEFKAWFGDWENDPANASMFVDENGEPMVVYHGAKDKFTVFDPSSRGVADHIFLTTDMTVAEKYGGNVMPLFVNARKDEMKTVDANGSRYDEIEWYGDFVDARTIADVAKERGLKGAFVRNIAETEEEILTNDIVIFDPTQIKSATDNSGAFDANNPDIRYSFAEDAKRLILKKRPDIGSVFSPSAMGVEEEEDMSPSDWQEIGANRAVAEIVKFPTSKERKAALHWFIKGAIRLPEDAPKVVDAIKYGEGAKGRGKVTDFLRYDSPMAMITALEDFQPTEPAIDPDTVPEFSDKKVFPMGVTTYAVADTPEGQMAVRKIINTHKSKKFNCWCLAYGDGKGGLDEDGKIGGEPAWYWWNHYNALPKRIAFKDGKLLAFMATDQVSEVDQADYIDDSALEWLESNHKELYDEFMAYAYPEGDNGDGEHFYVTDWLPSRAPEVYRAFEKYIGLTAEEKWWDLLDNEHEGIPLGNLPVPNDPFGRWANYEIRDGKAMMTSGFHKGERGEEGYIEWFANGMKSEAIIGDTRIYWRYNGALDRISVVRPWGADGKYKDVLKAYVYDEDGNVFKVRGQNDGGYYLKEDDYSKDEYVQNLIADAERLFREYDQRVPHGKGVDGIEADGTARFSLATYNDGGRETLKAFLVKEVARGAFIGKDAEVILAATDAVRDVMKKWAKSKKLAAFGKWSEAKVELDETGKPYFGVIRTNGDYAYNIDFSTVCKKRRPLDAVFAELVRRNIVTAENIGELLSRTNIPKIQEIIKSHGLEVACALCFVDAKRYNLGKDAEAFAKLWNGLVEEKLSNPSKFAKRLEDLKDEKTYVARAARVIADKPEAQVMVDPAELLSGESFDKFVKEKSAVASMYRSFKGQAKAKESTLDVAYNNDILNLFKHSLNPDVPSTISPEAAYAVGGVRLQSFSDFVARLTFDYVQMFAELAARKLPLHSYTKEPDFIKLFGKTCAKLNMSLVPNGTGVLWLDAAEGKKRGLIAIWDKDKKPVTKDGKTAFFDFADECFPPEEAFALRSADGNVGTIMVGVSDEHIELMLADPRIDMVIPYHKSSINPEVAKARGIDKFTDYTSAQHTKGAKKGKDFDWYGDLAKTNDPRKSAKNYLDWAKKNKFTPKFSKFAKNVNYYKLLADFRLFKDDGTYAPQGAVQQVVPDAEWQKAALAALNRDQQDANKLGLNLEPIIEEISTQVFGSSPRHSLSSVNNPDAGAYLIAHNIFANGGKLPSLNEVSDILKASHVVKDPREALGEASGLAQEMLTAWKEASSDGAVMQTLARAGLTMRQAQAQARGARAIMQFDAAKERHERNLEKAYQHQINNASGIEYREMMMYYGLDINELLKAMPPKMRLSAERTEENTDKEKSPVELSDMDKAVVRSVIEAITSRGKSLANEANNEGKVRESQEARNNPDKGTKPKKDNEVDNEDSRIGEEIESQIIAGIRDSGISVSNPLAMVALIRRLTEDYIKRNPSKVPDLDLNDVFSSRVALSILASNIAEFANSVAAGYSPSYARVRVAQLTTQLDAKGLTTLRQVERIGEMIFDNLNEDIIRQSRAQLMKRLHKGDKKTGFVGIDSLAKKHHANMEEGERAVSAFAGQYLKVLKRVVDYSQLECERRAEELEETLDSFVDVADKERFRDFENAKLELDILTAYGALRTKMPAEIMEASSLIEKFITEDLAALEERKAKFEQIREQVAEAIVAGIEGDPNLNGRDEDRDVGFMYSLMGMLEVRASILTSRCKDPAVRQAALDAFGRIERLMFHSATMEKAFVNDARDEMRQAVERVFGSESTFAQLLDTELDEATAKKLDRGSQHTKWRIGNVMQMYVSVVQNDYAQNCEDYGRTEGYALELVDILEKTDCRLLTMIDEMRAMYARYGRVLSETTMKVSGVPMMTPNADYMPVVPKRPLKAKNGEARQFSPYAPALTPRVKHGLDFDQTADIMAVWADRIAQTAHTIGYLETSSLIQGTLQSTRVLEKIASAWGKKAATSWNDYVFSVLAGVKAKSTSVDGVARKISKATSRLFLWGNLTSNLNQLAAIFTSALSRDMGGVLGMAKTVGMWGLKPAQLWKACGDLAKTRAFKARYGSDLNAAITAASREGKYGALRSFGDKLTDVGMAGLTAMDKVGIFALANVYYSERTALENGGMAPAEASERAAEKLVLLADKTAQGTNAMNASDLQNNGSAMAQMFLQFKTAPLQQFQYEYAAWVDWKNDKTNAQKARKLLSAIVVNHCLALIVPAMITALMTVLVGKGDDEKEWENKLAEQIGKVLGGAFGAVPFYGMLVDSVGSVVGNLAIGEKPNLQLSMGSLPSDTAFKMVTRVMTDLAKHGGELLEAVGDTDTEDILNSVFEMARDVAGVTWAGRTINRATREKKKATPKKYRW